MVLKSAPARLQCRISAITLLSIHVILLGYGAWLHSPTLNEPAHLAAGISYWKTNSFEVYCVNPPLVKMVAAIPVLIAGCETDWNPSVSMPGVRHEMEIGRRFSKANGSRILWLITIARWACIPFSLLGALVCYRWSCELYGNSSGLFALTLWCFCPNIIGHGQLISSDIASASFSALTCYTFWHWLKRPTWKSSVSSGVALGFAESTKTTLLILYPLWPIIWFLYRILQGNRLTFRDWFREGRLLLVRSLVSLFILNLVYGFEGSMTQLKEFRFVSDLFTSQTMSGKDESKISTTKERFSKLVSTGNRFADNWLGTIRLPFPKYYVYGIDFQRRDFENYPRNFFFAGQWSENGWWYFYICAAALKMPIGTLLLIIHATIVIPLECRMIACRSKVKGFDVVLLCNELVLLIPGLAVLAFVSSQTGINEHFRYVLPVFPFIYIVISRIVRDSYKRQKASGRPCASLKRALPIVLVGFSVVSSVMVCPHSLSYFNELVGGPRNGQRYLICSNIDWGQDLTNLQRWMAKHPEAKPLHLEYFGGIDPSNVGIECLSVSGRLTKEMQIELEPGWYAISVDRLVRSTDPTMRRPTISAFLHMPVIGHAGWSINIYYLDAPKKIEFLNER